MNPSPLPSLAEIIQRHGLAAKKSLGQHFLLSEAITERIVRYASALAGVNAIEIGPGPGGLTRALLRSEARHVYVVEKDDRAIAIMHELAEAFPGRLTILHEDALAVDLLARVPAPRKIIANLPYNIGTQLLLNWLEQIYSLSHRGRDGVGASMREPSHSAPLLASPLQGEECKLSHQFFIIRRLQ